MGNRFRVAIVVLTVLVGLGLTIPVMAEMSSAGYRIPDDVISGGGSAMSSSSYQLVGTLGQSSPLGASNTPTLTYTNYPGFWQADECVFDGDTDGLTNCVEYGLGTQAYVRDSDVDGLIDGEEVVLGLDGYTTDPLLFDTDGDLLGDGAEHNAGSNPRKTDTDNDGLTDGQEVLGRNGFSTNPSYWDSDHDGLPDKFESDNYTGHTQNLNPASTADGSLNFDSDTNSNVNEYWNGGDPWAKNPVGTSACGFWAEGDGDLITGPGDKSALIAVMKGTGFDYSQVIPPNGNTQELDMDGIIGPGDVSLITSFMKATNTPVLGSRPNSLVAVPSATTCESPSLLVGYTCHVTVAVHNESTNPSWTYTAGIPVIFSVDPPGAATIFGGEGMDGSGHRYDTTGIMSGAPGGRATVVIRPDTTGTIYINANILACGTMSIGRSCPALSLTHFAAINASNPP